MCLKEAHDGKLDKNTSKPQPRFHPTTTVKPKPIVTTTEMEETIQDIDIVEDIDATIIKERRQTLEEVKEELK